MDDLLSIHALQMGYAKSNRKLTRVVAGPFDWNVKKGELICLIGPNGSGKSTLLQTIAGHLNPLQGSVNLLGKAVHSMPPNERAQHMAHVLTRYPIVQGMTAQQSVALGRTPHTSWLSWLSEHDNAIVNNALVAIDALHLKDRWLNELSDGERQRLAIARALAQEAKLILLDEPTAFLDLPHRVGLLGLLRNLCRSTNVSAIVSTHDLDLALRFADKLVLLDGNGGIFMGAPETLALNGTIKKVFSSDQITFDLEHAHFQFIEEACAPADCDIEGIEGDWIKRALRRNGFRIESGAFPKIMKVNSTATNFSFAVQFEALQNAQNYDTLEDMLVALIHRNSHTHL